LRSKGQVTGNENVKTVFRVYLRQKWIDLHQTKNKISTNIVEYILPAKTLRFLIIRNLSLSRRASERHVAAAN